MRPFRPPLIIIAFIALVLLRIPLPAFAALVPLEVDDGNDEVLEPVDDLTSTVDALAIAIGEHMVDDDVAHDCSGCHALTIDFTDPAIVTVDLSSDHDQLYPPLAAIEPFDWSHDLTPSDGMTLTAWEPDTLTSLVLAADPPYPNVPMLDHDPLCGLLFDVELPRTVAVVQRE